MAEGEAAPVLATGKGTAWIELAKVLALPMVTLVLGYWFNASLNERQQLDTNMRLYAEMMGRREESDSTLRKDMFNSILETFIVKGPSPQLSPDREIEQQILSLELLAYNFHESLDIGPLFKDVARRIPTRSEGVEVQLRRRLETVALETIEHQLTVLADNGMVERGNALPGKIKDLQAYISYGAHMVSDPNVPPGEGVSRVCLSMEGTDGMRHSRQFKLEMIDYDEEAREVQVRLLASQILTEEECQQASLDLEGRREVDTNFRVGLFDFPMIDNTRLSNGERASVSLTALNPSVLSVALSYFPGSRASLKDKPYYDEVINDLVLKRQLSGALGR